MKLGERNKSLRPALNVRRKKTRVCANCRHSKLRDGFVWCVRPGGYSEDVGDGERYFMTCDGWVKDD